MITTINEFKKTLNENTITQFEIIKDIFKIVDNNSYFEYNGNDNEPNESDTTLYFKTNRHGVADEPGEEDFSEAHRIYKMIKEKYPKIECTIDSNDEWVTLEFRLNIL